MTRDEWLALAERCETAKGADREIDGDIAHAAKQFVDYLPRVPERPWLWAEFVEPDDWECWEAPEYTASLDAITALIERELPGSTFKVGRDGAGANYAQCAGKRITEAATPTLALCAAFCRAMAEKGEKG